MTDATEAHILASIASVHWHLILEVADEEEGPSHAYTIGLTEHCNHPELLLEGTDPDELVRLLRGAAERIIGGTRLQEGDELSPASPPLQFLKRNLYSSYLPYAIWYYGVHLGYRVPVPYLATSMCGDLSLAKPD